MTDPVYDEIEEGEIGDDEPEEFNDGYDENLMGDEDDQRKLAQMTEKEREQVLFDRSERRELLKTRFKVQRKLRLAKREREQEKKQSKQVRARKRLRASEIYSSDESSEESDEYTPDNVKSASDLNSGTKSTSKAVTRSTILSSSSSSSASSSASSEDSSEEENDNGRMSVDDRREHQEDFQMTINELKSLQLKREKIEGWIYEPFFKETAIGLFVRINTGTPGGGATPIYKVGQIIDVKQGTQVYAVNKFTGKFKTDKSFLLRIGQIDRSYQMSFVSNQSFNEDDFSRWLEQIRTNGHGMLSREHYTRKMKDLDKAHNYVYNDREAIEERIKEKTRFQDVPCNFALRKTELLGKMAQADADGDLQSRRELKKELDDLEEKAKRLERERSSNRFSAITFVNERNRFKNIVECEKALRESKIIRTEDPFTRRKCTPQIVHNRNNDFVKDSDTNAIEKNEEVASIEQVETVSSVSDLFQAHADIELDIDI